MSLNYDERSVESGDAFPLDSGFRRNDEGAGEKGR